MKKLFCLILVLILALSAASCELLTPKEYEILNGPADLIVHFIDVGQGDCTLLESRGEFVLIDAGESEYGGEVVKYIESRKADTLKYVIATHPHSDHIGGMKKVLKNVDTENFITVETDQSTKTWLNVLKTVEEKDINYIDAVPGDTYSFGEAEFTILAPNAENYQGYNDYSVVTMVTCGDIRFLLTGDAEKQSEKEMLEKGYDLKADVLKCGQHGSSSSSSAKFLKAVNPAYAIISCGKNNDYGHPHKETLKKLSLMDTTCYRTDQLGTIVAYTDGSTLSFSCEKGDLSRESYQSGDRTEAPDALYIGNKNSHVFHYAQCSGVSGMKENNKVEFTSREEAIAQGYKPCSLCNP